MAPSHRWLFAVILAAALFPGSARAIAIHYSLTPLGGDSYRYDYTVSNDGSLPAGAPVKLFDVMFDPDLYEESSLAIVSPPSVASDWDQILLASAPEVPAAYDALATGAGIASGGSVSGFAVAFHWLGAGTPGSQSFEISDPVTFEVLESGVTVPEPALGWLAAGAVALCLAVRRSSHK